MTTKQRLYWNSQLENTFRIGQLPESNSYAKRTVVDHAPESPCTVRMLNILRLRFIFFSTPL